MYKEAHDTEYDVVLSAADRAFLRKVERATFANPFGDER